MNRRSPRKATAVAARVTGWLWLALAVLGAAAVALIQRPVEAQEDADIVLTAAELEELVGPIALYPDDLVAIVLPASTYPLQIVEAARFLEQRKTNPSLTPDEDWDDSVVALLNYPEVVKLLNEDLDWTWDLGTAVLNQNPDVLDAIQDFRSRTYAAGNLRSDDRQRVTTDNGTITIAPANPQVIYVPYYEPRRVVVYHSAPVIHYHPWAYPVYYYPYPVGYSFRTGFFWGVTTAFSIGWHTHDLHVYHHGHHLHPYHGWHYHDPFYARHVVVNVNLGHRHDDIWRPSYRYGNRPIVRGTERRVYTAGNTPRTRAGAAPTGSTYRSRSTADRAPVAAGTRSSATSNASRTTTARMRGATPGTREAAPGTRSTVRDSANRDTASRAVPQASREYRTGARTDSPREIQRAAPDTATATNEARRAALADRAQRSANPTPPRTLGRVAPSEPPRAMPRSAPRVTTPPAAAANRGAVRAPSRPQASVAPAPRSESRPAERGGGYRDGAAVSRGGGNAGGRESRQARSSGGQYRSNGR